MIHINREMITRINYIDKLAEGDIAIGRNDFIALLSSILTVIRLIILSLVYFR